MAETDKALPKNDEKPKKSSNELAVIRTYFACERTYMASIRTNAIFAGLSLLLIDNNQQVPATVIVILCILINVFTTWNFYRSSLGSNSEHFTSIKERATQVMSPMLYSALLIVVLILILYVAHAK